MGARERIGVGIIGAGFARGTQVPAFQACPGVEVVSLASARRERAEAMARDFGIRHVSTDWRDVVRHPDVHLVCVSTPPHLHREMTLAALEAGKAVLCEKPTALDATEAEAMWRAARERGVLALLDHELRFLPARQRLREWVRSGELGALRHARVHYRSESRASPSRPWDWWSDAGQGGGVLGALGSHAVDAPLSEPLAPGMPEGEWSHAFVRFARLLTEALRAGRTTLEDASTLEDGWRNQRVLDAARRSHAERRWVVLSD